MLNRIEFRCYSSIPTLPYFYFLFQVLKLTLYYIILTKKMFKIQINSEKIKNTFSSMIMFIIHTKSITPKYILFRKFKINLKPFFFG